MVREEVQVADRRRWQSAMTSPIGAVGSEIVKGCANAASLRYYFICKTAKMHIPNDCVYCVEEIRIAASFRFSIHLTGIPSYRLAFGGKPAVT